MEKVTNKDLRQEIIDAYFEYYKEYASRNWESMVTHFDKNITMVGTAVDEFANVGEKTLATLKREFSQAPLPLQYDVKNLEVFLVSKEVALIMIIMDVSCHNQHEVVEFPNNRTSALMKKSPEGWKLVHGHWSQPDRDIDVGESVPYRLLMERSQELEKKVAVRTREIEAQKERLEKLNQTKNKLLSVVGHDLRTPFNSLLGFSRMLLEERDSLTRDEVTDIIKKINKQVGMAYGLLDNLLHWARTQDDKIPFNPEKIQLHTLAEDISRFLKVIADEKKVVIANKTPENLRVVADKLMLEIIIRNLMHNAVKYSRPGGQVTFSARPENGRAHITVADDGVGMDEKLTQKLQSGDYTDSLTGTANEKGTGIGLVLAREFIARHDSQMEIQSKKSNGSRFSFTLPLDEA